MKKREGKLKVRPVLFLIGFIMVLIAWFTVVPMAMSDVTGLANTFEYGGEEIEGGLGTRIWTSVLTAIGVVCVKFSIFRDKKVVAEVPPDYSHYHKQIDQRGE